MHKEPAKAIAERLRRIADGVRTKRHGDPSVTASYEALDEGIAKSIEVIACAFESGDFNDILDTTPWHTAMRELYADARQWQREAEYHKRNSLIAQKRLDELTGYEEDK